MPAPDSGAARCAECGAELAPSLLACPTCRRLVHADRLKQLAADAEAHAARGDASEALVCWREAADLLPPGSRQRATVQERIATLSAAVGAGAAAPKQRPQSMWGWLVAGGALLLSKAKLLLAGLTKASTLFSMMLAFGVYWTVWGWRFSLGFVASIFVHEMGHVAALRRFGIRATAPMFLPGIGAVVRFRDQMAPHEEAITGLAGPLWGTGAAIVTLAVALATGSRLWAAIAHTGAFVNLFNLLPIVPLDGGRGFRALSRNQRLATLPVIGGAWWLTGDALLLVVLLAAVYRASEKTAPAAPDRGVYLQYAGLVAGLAALVYAAAPLARLDG